MAGKGGQFSATGGASRGRAKPGGTGSYRASKTKSFGKMGATMRHGTTKSRVTTTGHKRVRAR